MRDEVLMYPRVSTGKQGDRGESIETQIAACIACVKERGYPEVKPEHIFSDYFSGRESSRPGWDRLVEYCLSNPKKVKAVVIYRIDRLSRGGAASYEEHRKILENLGIELIDAYGTIQSERNSIEETGFEYDWSKYRPSEASELMEAHNSKDEVRKILTRTVTAQISLVNKGYWNRQAGYGYQTKKIFDEEGKRRTILAPLEPEATHMREIFRLRALGVDDTEICKRVNAIGFRTREMIKRDKLTRKVIGKTGGKKLTPKMLQKLIQRFAYCGVICEKWTKHMTVKAQFKGLVDYETFSLANQEKIRVYEKNGIIYAIDLSDKKQRRQKHNKQFKFKGMIRCPKCKGFLLASTSNQSRKIPSAYYHCSRNHKYVGYRREELESNIESYLKSLQLSKGITKLLEAILIEKWAEIRKQSASNSIGLGERVTALKREKEGILETIIQMRDDPIALPGLKEKLYEVDARLKTNTQERNENELKELKMEDCIAYAMYFIEHPDEMLIDNSDPANQRTLFMMVFDEFPTYEEIINGTAKTSHVFEETKGMKIEKNKLVAPGGIEPPLPG